MNKDENLYLFLPDDLRCIVFDLESVMGVPVGGGKVFKVSSDSGGRVLSNEDAFIRMAALFIGNKHLNYSNSYLAEKFGLSKPMITYANNVIRGFLETNPRFRRKLFNVAIDNGIMDLVNEIEQIEAKREKVKEAFQ